MMMKVGVWTLKAWVVMVDGGVEMVEVMVLVNGGGLQMMVGGSDFPLGVVPII